MGSQSDVIEHLELALVEIDPVAPVEPVPPARPLTVSLGTRLQKDLGAAANFETGAIDNSKGGSLLAKDIVVGCRPEPVG